MIKLYNTKYKQRGMYRMEENKWDKAISPKADLLTYVKKGVLWVQKKPYYIVELIKEQKLAYVRVYHVQPGTESNPQKAMRQVTIKQKAFSTKTLLGQLANAITPKKTKVKYEPMEPAFIAPVIPNQINTFTGKREEGFFEREPDTITTIGGEKKYVRGKNTGVFIGLSSIVWDSKIKIPTESLVNVLTQYREDTDGFFDFEHNDNDKFNPLSSNYVGGE